MEFEHSFLIHPVSTLVRIFNHILIVILMLTLRDQTTVDHRSRKTYFPLPVAEIRLEISRLHRKAGWLDLELESLREKRTRQKIYRTTEDAALTVCVGSANAVRPCVMVLCIVEASRQSTIQS